MTDLQGAAPAPDSLITGRLEVMAAWRDLLLGLGETHRQVTILDASIADYPLDEPAVIEALTRWLRLPGRQVRLIGQDFDAATRALPRFVRWRRDWAHAISAWAPFELPRRPWPRLLLCDDAGVERLDAVHWRARRLTDLVPSREAIDACMQRCEPAWPVYSLGL